MGVSEQRYSSSLIKILLVAILLSPPVGSPRAFAAAPALALSDRDPITAVRLPPAMEAFLMALIGTANLDRPGAVEFLDHQVLRRRDQLLIFKAIVKDLVRTYRKPSKYSGPKIQSLTEYVNLVEPTRMHTGSLEGDMHALFDKMGGGGIPPAVQVSDDQFASNRAQVDAELFEFDRTSRLHQIIETIVGNGNMSPTVVAKVLAGAMGVMFTARGTVNLLRSFEEHMRKQGDGGAVSPEEDEIIQEAEVEEALAATNGEATNGIVPQQRISKSQQKKMRRDAIRNGTPLPPPVTPSQSSRR